VRDQVSHPYSTTCKITVLYNSLCNVTVDMSCYVSYNFLFFKACQTTFSGELGVEIFDDPMGSKRRKSLPWGDKRKAKCNCTYVKCVQEEISRKQNNYLYFDQHFAS
jgi:hypothetical protein